MRRSSSSTASAYASAGSGCSKTQLSSPTTISTSCVSSRRRSDAERAAQQLAQLVLVRQPQRVFEGDGVERPLGRAVEGEDAAGRIVARLDRHLADGEDVGLELGLVELEPVARPRVPDQPRLPQRDCQFRRDHANHHGPARGAPGSLIGCERMPAPVTLPRLSWGDPVDRAPRAARPRPRFERGADVAVRGRSRRCRLASGCRRPARTRTRARAPSTTRSTRTPPICAAPARPRRGGWDLVVAHSLGGAAATVAAASDPDVDAPARARRSGDPPRAARPRHRAHQPGGVVRRPDRRGRARRAPALARARHRAQGAVGAPGEPVGRRADERCRTPTGTCGMPHPR